AGAVLIGIAITLWIKRHAELGKARKELPSARNLAGHLGRGFLVNTFSPFTVIFWPSLVLTKALNTEMDRQTALLFFGSVILALMIGDTLKSIFAEWIRRRLKDRYIRTSRVVFAIVFATIGLYLLTRAVIALVTA
ncbi:MAG: LysE family transporter, partial [Saprospiraceae bacterium]|nr:LysE family transporter [Saprospiraceae bacterium]